MNWEDSKIQRGYTWNQLVVEDIVQDTWLDACGNKQSKGNWKYWCRCNCCGERVSMLRANVLAKKSKTCRSCAMKKIGGSNKKVNPIEVIGDVTNVFFFNTTNYTIVDSNKYHLIKDYCWFEHHGYAETSIHHGINNKKSKSIRMHQVLLNVVKDHEVDHWNRNKLDNTLENLRICTHQQNTRNRSKGKHSSGNIVGVTWNSKGYWHARISINGMETSLGYFKNQEDAIEARLEAEKKYYGEFSPNLSLKGD